MATRSNIGTRQEDGTIKAIYCHWDGYPEGVGATLTEHYNDPAKVEALLNLGDFSSIADNIEEIESYAQRGEKGTEARTYATQEEWIEEASDSGCEYLYLFEKNWQDEYVWAWYSIGQRWHKMPSKFNLAMS